MKRLISSLLMSLFACIFIINLGYAANTKEKTTKYSSWHATRAASLEQVGQTKKNAFKAKNSLSSGDFGIAGPLSFNIVKDELLGYFFGINYTQKITDRFAVAAVLENGLSKLRFGGTIGFALNPANLFKISAEQLSEVLPFNFDSGKVFERIRQNAIGARYKYQFDNTFIQNIGFGGYYAKAQSKTLNPLFFTPGVADCAHTIEGCQLVNFRHIAGGLSKGLDIESEVKLTSSTLLKGKVLYDSVNYDTINDPAAAQKYNSSRFGGALGLTQLLGDNFKLTLDGSARAIYDTYQASISWLPAALAKMGLEVSLVGQRLVSHNSTPSSNSFGVQFTMSLTDRGKYQLPSGSTAIDITSWTKEAAVRMERVLAITDQLTRAATSAELAIYSVAPLFGPSNGGTLITIVGSGFVGMSANKDNAAPIVFFGGAPGTIVSATPTEIKVYSPPRSSSVNAQHNPSYPVDITVRSADGRMSAPFATPFIYVDGSAPAVNDFYPAVAVTNVTGQTMTINGANFAPAAEVYFDETQATVISTTTSSIKVVIPKAPVPNPAVAVTVANPDGQEYTPPAAMAYVDAAAIPPPAVASVTPDTFPAAGANKKNKKNDPIRVQIDGSDFVNPTIDVGGYPVVVTSFTATRIMAEMPDLPAGSPTLAVRNVGGATPPATAPVTFTPSPPSTPSFDWVNPYEGESDGGYSIALHTSDIANIADVTQVTFTAPGFSANAPIIGKEDIGGGDGADLWVTVPAYTGGQADVTITLTDAWGQTYVGTGPDQIFSYLLTPKILSLSADSGTVGDDIVLLGKNFDTAPDAYVTITSSIFPEPIWVAPTNVSSTSATITIPDLGSASYIPTEISFVSSSGATSMPVTFYYDNPIRKKNSR